MFKRVGGRRVGKVCLKCRSRIRMILRDGTSQCLECHRRRSERNRKVFGSYRYTNARRKRELRRVWTIQTRYKITDIQYLKLASSQRYKCAICKLKMVGRFSLCVDHCHKTGSVRGLLCSKCNSGIGMFSDSMKLLLSAVKYLSNFKPTIST